MTGLTVKRLGTDKQSKRSRPKQGCSVIGSLAPMNSLMDGTATD
ncbi:hypothetical protein [Rosenbergiella nectarea]|nr:hypothetical protein [Rosenbergiella nectarea]